MKSTKKKTTLNFSERDSSGPMEGSVALVEVKDKLGLPKWQDLSKELSELAERHDISWAAEVQAKVELHKRYVEYQTILAQNFSALGLQHVNALHNVIDLQNKLFELEDKLRRENVNPLESPEWVKARELLAKEMQFIHKHGLDQQKFQVELEKTKKKTNDDVMYVVD